MQSQWRGHPVQSIRWQLRQHLAGSDRPPRDETQAEAPCRTAAAAKNWACAANRALEVTARGGNQERVPCVGICGPGPPQGCVAEMVVSIKADEKFIEQE